MIARILLRYLIIIIHLHIVSIHIYLSFKDDDIIHLKQVVSFI